MILARGSVVIVALDPTEGHEQRGRRPCIVVSSSDLASMQRYRVLVVVPLTSRQGLGHLYPVVQPYPRGLTVASTVLVDQIRAIDKMRVMSQLAQLPAGELIGIDVALRRVLAL